jgi:hypothetical protein
MPTPKNQEILDAMTTRFLTISGIGTRVFDYYLPYEGIPGTPTLCFYATSEDALNRGMESTRRKMWEMVVGVVGYVEGGDVRAKAYTLAQDMENIIEAEPTVGVLGCESVRVFSRNVSNIGSEDPQYALAGRVDILFLARYRYTAGSL